MDREVVISQILEEVKIFWMNNPELRFGQAVVSVLGIDPFYLTDNVTLEKFLVRNERDSILREV